jgi:hypothetical protein
MVRRLKFLSIGGTERAIVDGATNLQQEIGAASRPSQLLLVWTAPDGIDCGAEGPSVRKRTVRNVNTDNIPGISARGA